MQPVLYIGMILNTFEPQKYKCVWSLLNTPENLETANLWYLITDLYLPWGQSSSV